MQWRVYFKFIIEQAYSRVYRIGQRKNVIVLRFCVYGSIEERIMFLKEYKSERIKGNKGLENASRPSKRDIDFLLGLAEYHYSVNSDSDSKSVTSASTDSEGYCGEGYESQDWDSIY
jgi:hypothetical protein